MIHQRVTAKFPTKGKREQSVKFEQTALDSARKDILWVEEQRHPWSDGWALCRKVPMRGSNPGFTRRRLCAQAD